MTTAPPSVGRLRDRLPELSGHDRRQLQQRLDRLQRQRDERKRVRALVEVATAIDTAADRIEHRRAAVPAVTYPAQLPVSQRKDDIAAAIRDSQVVVVAGETGSGKTTQLPKICLELGRGVRGLIGHTQPRRIAARAVADRIAEELNTSVGDVVGYKVRFTDRSSDDTLIKVMTDGILLAEIQSDRDLLAYDTVIIDEAHERSLNIDFLLGYLKQLLPRRPDLKIIITSATIDPERFSRHFDGAPIVEVSGRMFPVEVRYRSLVDDDANADDSGEPRDQVRAICDAIAELSNAGPGDILVFLSGEREIRDTADALRRQHLRDTEILPLYARLSAAEQHRVFQAHRGRRIVLATNVAETSLTVPGIRYVVDPGTARISRYSSRLKVQRLPIEPISQASANQRKGRCGRVADGICIRLYSEEDFASRPEFTDPEVLRTNLASVILQMTALDLGDIAAFPFVDPPDRRQVRDGVDLLHELGALEPDRHDGRRRLTPMGRMLSQLQVDPRLARMIVEAADNSCVTEVLVIAAALSIQDPRERPLEHQQAADDRHRRFVDPTSDFVAYLNLWAYLQEQQRSLSSSAFRRLCKSEYLHYLRVREWQDLVAQLRQSTTSLGLSHNSEPAEPQRVHVSVLSGLLSHIGLRDVEKQEYVGARGARFALFPGSALFRRPPRWVMAAELVETSRLWGRINARIEPDWIEPLAQHLVKRTHSEPHWSASRGAAMAYERVTLYGVPVVTSRLVPYGRIDPELSRELFIRHALVEGEWRTHHRFWHENRELLREAEELEHRARRRDIVVNEETLFDFYDRKVPPEVTSARHFDAWWKRARRDQPDLLSFEKSMLLTEEAASVTAEQYPTSWRQGDLELQLSYQFAPGAAADGVTVHIPLPILNRVSDAGFDWQVPGLRHELATALLRALPKTLRRNFVPAADMARLLIEEVQQDAGNEPLLDALSRALRRRTGVAVPHDAWNMERIPPHLRMSYRIEDEQGTVLAEDKDLDALKRQLQPRIRQTVARAASRLERFGLTQWSFGDLPATVQDVTDGHTVEGFPALVDEGNSVAIRILPTESEQRRSMWAGVRRLLLLTLPAPIRDIVGRIDNQSKIALGVSPYSSVPTLLDDCLAAAVDLLMKRHGGPVRDQAAFERLRELIRPELPAVTDEVVRSAARILGAAASIERRIAAERSMTLLPSLADVQQQLAGLIFPGFVSEIGAARLNDVERYLQAMQRRLDVLPDRPGRDREAMTRWRQVRDAYHAAVAALPPHRRDDDDVMQIRWMLEELRVSLFAQGIRTAYAVSEKRIMRAVDRLSG
jgi:ATP-dependent helicase HrpA